MGLAAVSQQDVAHTGGHYADVPFARKAFYGSAGLGFGCVEYIVAVYLLKYYTDHAGLSPYLAGGALLLGKLFDGISDPVMGYLSDRTKSRFGRRRPWFIVGAIPLVASFVAMFAPAANLSQMQMFWWLTFFNMMFFVGTTMVEVPHAALGGELTRTHQQRVSIMGWRQGFSSTGLFIGAAAPIFFIQRSAKHAASAATAQGMEEEAVRVVAHSAAGSAHTTIALVFGVIVFCAFVISFAGTREPTGPRTPPRDSIFGDFMDTLISRPFRFFMICLLFSEIAGGLTATLVLYAIGDWWGFKGLEAPMIMSYLFCGVISIPVWVRIGQHFDKHHMFSVGAFMAALALFAMLFTPQIGPWWGFATLIFSGMGFGARAVMALAIVPDIVDDDELRTHTRKDGAYFGMWSLLRKIARALALGLSGIGLGYFGYEANAGELTEQAIQGISIMYAVIPGVGLLVTSLLILAFPLTRARHADVLAQLEKRRVANAAT